MGTEVRVLEKYLCLRDLNKNTAHEESQKINPESLGQNLGEFSIVEAKDVKISNCQKMHGHQRYEKEAETIDVAIMRILIDLWESSFKWHDW